MTDPTPEQVEAAAVAFTCETQDEWERSPDTYKEMIREDTRSALVAAASAAPVQVDEAKLAELIAKASMKYNLSDRSGESHACGAPDYRSAYIAHDIAEWLRGGAQ